MSENKALFTLFIDGKQRKFGIRNDMRFGLEMLFEDEHDRVVAYVEMRRQPDNELVLKVYGQGDEVLFEQVMRRGKDRRRADVGVAPVKSFPDIDVAKGAR